MRCVDGVVYGVINAEKCIDDLHYLNFFLAILGVILLTIWCIFMLNFSFYPFQKIKSTIRINSNNDIMIIVMKLIIILQYFYIKNDYISIVILNLVSITMFYCCYYESTYNIAKIETMINIKNFLIVWTYFILLFSKILHNIIETGFFYLLIFGYPIVIYLSVVISRQKYLSHINFSGYYKNLDDYIRKVKLNIKLIESFLDNNKNLRNGNENEGQRNIILLQGNIELHCLDCPENDCSLRKYLINDGNYNIQRQCLLNYMNVFF
jgi:hypothetical protein